MSGPPRTKRVLASFGDSIPAPAPKTSATAEATSKKGRFFKPLPKEFRRDGFLYRQIVREGDAAIYKQKWGGCSNPGICFEVIRIRRRDGFQIGTRFIEAAEVYPNSEAWGVDGFTFTDRDSAFKKLKQMSPAEPAKPNWNRYGDVLELETN